MGIFKWYKRDPHAAIVGMAELTFEEVGVYTLLLDHLWIKDGKLPDDLQMVARKLHTNARRWRRLRASLIRHGKIYVLDGHLRNERLDREFRLANGKAQRKSLHVIRGGRK